MSREMTTAEMQEALVRSIHNRVQELADNEAQEFKLNELAKWMLALIDSGNCEIPPFKLIVAVDSETTVRALDEGKNYWLFGSDLGGDLEVAFSKEIINVRR